MQKLSENHQPVTKKRWRTAAIVAAIVGIGGFASFAVIGQSAPPNIQALDIASEPLYAATQGDKPALALALSVEYPTVGAQYVDQPGANTDSSYSPDKEYLGYYNDQMCYTYNNNPTETPAAGKTSSDYKRFVISGAATNHRCNDAFSGNFLNWASNSAIDMLRLALSGGDRVIDEEKLTVLQRAVLPGNLNAGPGGSNFWNSTNFPAKELKKGDGTYFGAIPKLMRDEANSRGASSIWVGNRLNHIYFGATKSSNPADYILVTGKNLPASAYGGTGSVCADENGTCSIGGTLKQVWYGAPGKGWATMAVSGSVPCNNSVFGDPAIGTRKKCYLENYSASNAKNLNTEGFFYSRVEVCSQDASGELTDKRDYRFCTRYPSGYHKPIGTIQHYNSQLRLAAFGYAIDNTLSYDNGKYGRYGGVLRAPMKFVGPKVYSTSGIETGANPHAEWDDKTGILYQNPLNDTTYQNSGVINYLNKFGRLLPNKQGNYKTYDPASELYYEALRYMQGLQPSSAAVSGLTSDMYDGFPIYTDWSGLDPYGDGRLNTSDYSCVRSNIALIGDVNTHDSKRYGKSRMPGVDLANNIPDINHWLKVVQAFESKQAMSYTNGVDQSGNPIVRTTSNPNNASYSGYPANNDYRSSEIIGLSYWAHTQDIRGRNWTSAPDKQRPGLRIKTFIFDVNEYGNESIEDKRRTRNQYYTAAKYGGFNTQPTGDANNTLPYNAEGNPFYNQKGEADNNVWQDPKRQLEPQSYFLQSDARGVLEAFEKIFSEASSKMRNIAGSSASSSNLASSDLFQYQASFNTEDWSGDVEAFAIKKSADGVPTLEEEATWSAEKRLSQQFSSAASVASRKIFVGVQRSSGAGVVKTATPFTQADIETALQNMLNKPNAEANFTDGLWRDRVEYLRGVKTKEGSQFRLRARALGDIVNSGVVYVGAPSTSLALGDGYDKHAVSRKNRTAVVYVGANDGMLHAFDAKTGDELFAYIPSWMGPKLSALTSKDYKHQAYVDATPVIGEAKTGKGTNASDWKTVLVSGTGGGGKGVFALDVSDPKKFGADSVLWEFNQVDDPDMGYVIGKSRIVKMQTQHKTVASAGSKDVYRWFALVPAGANNYVDSGDGVYSKTGNSTIFLLALDKPVSEAWELGKNYYKISLPFDKTLYQTGGASTVRATGIINLESFTANASNTIDLVYAGDLHGNVWALSFTGLDANKWNTAANLSRFVSGSTAIPMYAAKDAQGIVQPITAAPSILRVGATDAYMVGFGTGKYIEETDPSITQPGNTYYVLYDDGKGALHNTTDTVWKVGIPGRGRLKQVVIAGGTTGQASAGFRFGRPASDTDSDRAGWYHDLTESGERIVSDGTARPYTSSVVVNSITPRGASTPGICPVDGGTSRQYVFDYFSAVIRVRVSPVGLAGQPLLFIDNSDLGKADSTGRRLRKIKPYTLYPGTEKSKIEAGDDIYMPVGRLSWRQINNYLELRNQK